MDNNTIDKIITKGQADIETGIPVLNDMIKYILNDIKTLDEEGSKTLKTKMDELNNTNKKRKESIIQKFGQPSDSLEDRTLKRQLLREDHNKYKQLMVLLQDFCYRKGWFD